MSGPWPQEVDSFVSAARVFVSFCERSHEGEKVEEVRMECLRLLAAIYDAGLHIPEVPFHDAPEPPSRSDQGRLTEKLSVLPFQYYTEAMEPANLDKNGNVAIGDLFDDFIDIHGDLSAGLWLLDQGHWEAAIWHWRLLIGTGAITLLVRCTRFTCTN